MITNQNERVFWIVETLKNGRRIDHFLHLSQIPSVCEFNPDSKKNFRELWNGIWRRVTPANLNQYFISNQIEWSVKK